MICCAAVLVIGAVSAAAQTPAQVLEVTIQPRQQDYGSTAPIVVEFIIKNTSNAPVRILSWHTPLDGVTEDFLRVVRGSQVVPYIGPIVKRLPPTARDYVTIAPGASLTATVDLGENYGIQEPGPYSVAYNVDARALMGPSAGATRGVRSGPLLEVRSNAAAFQVTAARALAPGLRSARAPSQFEQCNDTQQAELKVAIPEAANLALSAVNALKEVPAAKRSRSKRYTAWFGEYTDARYTRILGQFQKIHDAIANKSVSFHCAGDRCKDTIFAYVFAGQPYRVHVCGKFWTAALNGTDSRSGTILHEVSHFSVVAGTDDHQYGHNNSKELAKEDPEKAASNADSHEYFAENTPNLTM